MTKQEATIKYITENYLNHNRLRHDIVADKLQVRVAQNLGEEANRLLGERQEYWREMTKHDINSIVCHCAQEYDQNITSREVMTALQSDLIPDVHPLREYIRSLPAWKPESGDWINFVASQVRVKNNGEDKIQHPKQLDPTIYTARNNTASGEGDDLNDNNDNLRGNQLPAAPEGNYLTANTMSDPTESGAHGLTSNSSQRERSEADRFWRQCFKKWFVAMVASWMKDEVVNHTVLVLVGRQGIFKTTWLERLIPPELREYSSKLPLSGQISKDDRLRLCENAMLNIDELDAICGREMNIVKSLLTSTDVNERAAYGRLKERRVRLASFCASTNNREFLTDITGNRRWLPFEVESIQNPFHTTLPYEYLYAQAKHLVEQGWFSYWFDLQEIEVLEKHNEEFRAMENEEQLLPILFDVPAEGKGEFMTTAEISDVLVTYGGIKKPMKTQQLGVLMGKLKFKKAQAYMSGTCVRGWMVHKRLDDEIIRAKKNDIDHATKQQSDVF